MDIKLTVVIQYQQKEILDYKTIETGVLRALDKMATRLEDKV